MFLNICSTEKHAGKFLTSRETPTYGNENKKQNKIAIDIARNLLQYCQLWDKNSRRTSLGICNFCGTSKFLYFIHNFQRNP